MAKLEDRGQRGLPPPPAPPRRRANPWGFSDTARKREPPPRPEEAASKILDQLLAGEPPQETPPESAPVPAQPREPQSPWKPRRRTGFVPLLVLLLIAGVVIKLIAEARETGDWRELIPAIFVILFIAHGIWRARRRRGERGGEDDGP